MVNTTLANVIASLVIVIFVLYVGLILLSVATGSLTMAWFGLYSFVVLMSATKLYGKGVYEAVKSVGKNMLPAGEK